MFTMPDQGHRDLDPPSSSITVASSHTGQTTSQGPARILLVEDAVDHALLVQILLRKAGNFVTTHCQDGGRALELLKDHEFDLVITDLNLPGADGLALIRHVKSSRPHVPVLVTTGYSDPDYAYHAYRAGADEVLVKPVDRDALLRNVRNALGIGDEEGDGGGVLAVGARAGDVELGSGGTLVAHRDRGEPVVIVLLRRPEALLEDMARTAADVMGATLLVPDASLASDDPPTLLDYLQRVIAKVRPHAAYIPAGQDDAQDRREAHHLALTALADVANVVTYPTATIGLEYRPNRFVHLGKLMARKLEILSAYRDSGRRDLGVPFAEASARYWGRLAEFGAVEPLEVLRSGREER